MADTEKQASWPEVENIRADESATKPVSGSELDVKAPKAARAQDFAFEGLAGQIPFPITLKTDKDAEDTKAAPKWDPLSTLLITMGLLLVSAALVVGSYPFLSYQWGAYRANQQFTQEIEQASIYDQDIVAQKIADAEAYNAAIAGGDTEAKYSLYDDQLGYGESAVISWLDIPSLDIKIPVYRDDGTEEVTQTGAEHVRGSSLPVGGESANVVITAHSGSHAGTSMAFNKLDFIEHDALVILWTYGIPYAYREVGWEQTSPEDTESMKIKQGEDQLTLLTCRPIGTTAKRLYVHCKRVDYTPDMAQKEHIELLAAPDLPLFIGTLVGAGILIWLILLAAWRKKTVWYLNRRIGEEGMDEQETARLNNALDETMRLELRIFRKMRLHLYGNKIKGSWRRDKEDASVIICEFDHDAMGESVILRGEDAPKHVPEKTRLPRGEFEMKSLDDELALPIEYNTACLVFKREKPKDDYENEEGGADA